MRLKFLVLIFLPALTQSAELAVTIEGLEDNLAQAARASLTLQQYVGRDATPAQIRRQFTQAEGQIRRALEPYGYYNPTVQGDLQTTDKGFNAVFRVTPGDPVTVRESRVEVHGEGATRPAVRRALRRFKPEQGERLDHGLYEQSKEAVHNALIGDGYLRSKATQHRVEVSRGANAATIDLAFESGPRYRFGPVHFQESQFPPEFLERYVPWKEQAYYDPDQLLALQQRLVDADYFSTVVVQPDLQNAQPDGVPINVELIPAKRSVYTAGVYMSTDTGPGVRLGTQRRWMNRKGHKANISLDYAQRMQDALFSYQIPLPGDDDRSYNFGAGYRDEDTDTSQSRNARLAANETRLWHGFTRTLGLQYLGGNFEIADERGSSNLLFAEAVLSKKQANDFAFPRRGWSAALGLRMAPEGLLSDTSFSQVTLDGRWVRTVARRQRVLLRTSLGAMAVDDFNALPPELRFFAGGDRSIRGFDYQALGTTNASNQVIGGELLAVGSAEYEYYFNRSWGAAVFVDGGDAFRTGEFDLNIGAGFGVRWRSPVGVVRVDVGKPVYSDLADVIRLHVSIGPDL